ncbi:hypothetical protein GJ629_10655 [Halapricum sp. CBA1109]|uniref:hypothetical protein n=1 Tax=Halapricum sp. CBA1109 TaxID=2668068 RepID=UPI0012F99F8B|nr:hypothetical protein [Halapricum sp. CBA1109]MUV90298.1 hypothetical protein [Halapricum sp. CBA1109]
MTDTQQTQTTDEPFEEYDSDPDAATDRSDAQYYAELLGAGVLLLLGAIAAVGFYTSVSTAISRLVVRQYEPLFQAAFNLVVLLVVGVGLSLLWRRRHA